MPLVEQPISSLLMEHDRMKWLLKLLRRHKITVACRKKDVWLILMDILSGSCCCRFGDVHSG